MVVRRVTKNALAAKAADANKAVALKAAGLTENATVPEVVKLFKQTVGEGEKSVRDIMRKLAELAGLLVDGYGLTQEQVAEKVGRSQPWVSNILRWRRDGYKAVAFGPETHKPKLLPANNSAPAPTPPPVADTATRAVTGNGDDPAASAEARKAENVKLAGETVAEPGIPEPTAEPVAPRQLTAEELSDDALTGFKNACNKHCPIMSEADLKQARVYFMEAKWKPRPDRKAA